MATDELTPESIELRRNQPLAAIVGASAGILCVLYGWRAVVDGAVLDWLAFGVLAVIAVVHAAALLDSRAPLLVADRQGVRVREGGTWTGIAWTEVECLEHLPRRGLRDGHLLVVGPTMAQVVVPLSLATRLHGATTVSVSDDLAALAAGRADVVEVVPGLDDEEYDDPPARPEDTVDVTEVRRAEPVGVLANDSAPEPATPGPGGGLPGPARLISNLLHRGARGTQPVTVGANALHARPDVDEDIEEQVEEETAMIPAVDEDVEDTAVRVVDTAPVAAAGEATMTVVLPDLTVDPAEDAVIGPQLRAARERLRLAIDQLAERTRIRPHVLEAMEADDFGACGGDFYARGHLRTLGRVLGIETGPLLAAYDERYADAPVDPKRIFASELATGAGGTMRGTHGGRHWSVLVAAIMAAVLLWSVAQLILDGPVPVGEAPVLNQSGGIANAVAPADAVPVTLTAVGGGAKIVVRDGGGGIVFDGRLAFGQSTQLDVVPPVRIQSSDGSVTAALDGKDAKPLGDTGESVSKTLVP